MKCRIEVEWDDFFEGVSHVGIADAVFNELLEGYFINIKVLADAFGKEVADKIEYLFMDIVQHLNEWLSFLNRLEEGAEMVRNTETEK